ncbi:MAG: hypothetical protein NVS3B21_18210 [Acidimicrobiales bacterium]
MSSVNDDRADDRRFAYAVGGLMIVEVALAGLADSGVIALWVWLVTAVIAILVAGLWTLVGQRRAARG